MGAIPCDRAPCFSLPNVLQLIVLDRALRGDDASAIEHLKDDLIPGLEAGG